jgi:hypothetical protein
LRRSSQRRLSAWVWGCRFAALSSNLMAASFPSRRADPMDRVFASNFQGPPSCSTKAHRPNGPKGRGAPGRKEQIAALAQWGHCGRRRQQPTTSPRRVGQRRAPSPRQGHPRTGGQHHRQWHIRVITTRREIHSAGCVPIVRKRNNGPTRPVVVSCFGDWRI